MRETHHRYWRTGGSGIAIVAVLTRWDATTGDWAAYIGATEDTCTEEETVSWAASHGAKLMKREARFFFPQVALPYRE